MDQQKPDQFEDSSLETSTSSVVTSDGKSEATSDTTSDATTTPVSATSSPAETDTPPQSKAPGNQSFKQFIMSRVMGVNIYLLLLVFIVVVAGVIAFLTFDYARRKNDAAVVNTTTLTQDTLDSLASQDAVVGSSNQILSVQSSAVFAGKVLARSDLEVAGNLQIGGALNLPSISVAETAALGQATVSKNLAVTGDIAVQGQQTIAKSLQVGGTGTFSGRLSAPQIATDSLQLNGDLVLTRHLTAGGGTPNRSNGAALGSGGTTSISGSDTAGSITINTGSGPGAGCFITVTFTSRYAATPHILVTPVGSAAAGLGYYVNRSTSSFSVCTTTAAPAGASFGFDYFVVG